MTAYTAATNRDFAHRTARQPFALALMAAATLALLLGGHAPAATAGIRWVNDDAASYSPPGTSCNVAGYAAIQTAINAASPGDVIRVCPGAYHESVAIGTSNLTVASTAPAPATVVTAAPGAHVFDITATGVTLQGFTIAPAGFADGDIGVNVAIDGATKAKILDNAILGGRIGVNLGCTSFGSVVAYNTVNGQTEGGINIDTCEARPFPGTHNNSIHHNIACSVTATASIALGGSSNNNQINDNVATSISVWGHGNNVHHNITQLVIVANSPGNILNNNTADPGVCSISYP